MAKNKKVRKAARVFEDDTEGEAQLPIRKTKEIAEEHKATNTRKHNDKFPPVIDQIGSKADGKELFDFVLKGMASPDKK